MRTFTIPTVVILAGLHIATFTSAFAQVNVPDPNFRAALSTSYGITFDGSNNITNPATAAAVTTLALEMTNIADLTGIEAFTGLTILYCNNNLLAGLDLTSNTALTYLDCHSNQLTSLNITSNTLLTDIQCQGNQLTSLDVSANTALNNLLCNNNQLTSLNVSANTALKTLVCFSNQLTSLDVSANTALTALHCYSNPLTSLDISANTALKTLYCYSNQLTSLDVSANTALTQLYCFSNQLTSLDVSANTALTTLWCYSNQLTSLDISANTALMSLSCGSNPLMSLDVSANIALTQLYCSSIQLTSLNVSANTALTTLDCNSNQLTNLDVSANTALTFLYCQSNRIPIVLTDGSVTTINKDAITQVATFRSSSQNPTVGSSETGGYVLGTTGAIVNVTANSGASSAITTTTATNTNVGAGLPAATTLLSDKFWTLTNPGLVGTYNLILDLTPFSGITNFDSVKILKRSDSLSAWQNAAGMGGVTVQYLEPFVLVNGLTSFSDFAVGIGYAPINVPDANFRAVLSTNYGITFDGSNNITNPATAAAITSLDVSSQNIADLTGIEAFTSLTTLYCSFNQLTSLSLSANTALQDLQCHHNQLSALDLSVNTALAYLNCSENQIAALDFSTNTALATVEVNGNELSNLDLSSNPLVFYLQCNDNSLTSLDVSVLTALTTLYCQDNLLPGLDVSSNTLLNLLYCHNNQLTSLDLSNNTALSILSCTNNDLASLDLSANTALTQLFCYSNQLTSLDVSSSPSLTILSCFDNQLTALDVSGNTLLATLACNDNQLSAIDVSNNTALNILYCENNQLTTLDVSNRASMSQLYCDGNNLTSLTLSNNPALSHLRCYDNQLTALNLSAAPSLQTLMCENNELTSLDLSINTALTSVQCQNNNLTGLDVSNNSLIAALWCSNNQLTWLDVHADTALYQLLCEGNQIPIILTDGSVSQVTKDAITQVATFRSSSQSPTVGSSETGGYVLGTTGVIVNVTANSGASSTITTTTATNTNVGAGLPSGSTLLSDKFWTLTNPGLVGTYNLILDLTPFSGITNFDSVKILKRSDSSSAWQNVAGIGGVTVQYLEPFVLVNGLTSFSDFAVGMGYAPINVPDANFRAVLSTNYGITFDGSNNITNPATAAGINGLYVQNQNIADLTGIEAFTGLDTLYCSSNQLTSLDVSANTALKDLQCQSNQLTSLDVSANAALRSLSCSSNQLTSLDVSTNTTLIGLNCSFNQLTSLDVSANTGVGGLDCSSNQLTSLDVSANTALQNFWCSSNQLASLDVSANTALQYLDCDDNQLTTLDVSANAVLQYLYCYSNQLTNLDVSANAALIGLNCSFNQLTSLDVSANTTLISLNCSSNQLTSLDVSASTTLIGLNCYSNQLTGLDISANTALTTLYCGSNRIPIVLTDGSVTTINKDAITQVATFRSSSQNPTVGSSETGGYVLGTTGAIVNITANSGASSAITTTTATNTNVGAGLPSGSTLLSDKFWTLTNPDLVGTYNLILDLTPFSGITSFDSVRILKRSDSLSAWQNAAGIGGVTVQYLEPFVLVNGLTSFSDFAAAIPDLTPPTSPQNLSAVAGNGQVSLTWNANAEPDFARYRIYQSTSTNASVQVDSTNTGASDTTRTIAGLINGTTYFFRVSAVDSSLNVSGYSNEVSAVPLDVVPPAAPQDLTATAGDGQVTIKWNKNTESDFARYRVYRSTSAGATTQIDSSSSASDTSRTYTGLTKGVTYFFRLAAVDNANNQSAYSNEVSATVFAVAPTITTAVLQNPALSIYFDIVVVSLSDLASPPSVKLWITGMTDTSAITMSALSGSPHVYIGEGEFSSSGTYNIRTRATSLSGGDTVQTNTYTVSLAKPGVITKLIASNNNASVQINANSIKEATYFISGIKQTGTETIYDFGPSGTEYAEALDIEITYEAGAYPDEGKLFIYRKDGEEWKALRSQVYAARNTVKARVTQLGEFKIVYDASFMGTNLIPNSFALSQNYPNPFNPSTTIRYELPEDGFLTIKIYNLLGQEVKTLVSGVQLAGVQTVLWDGRNANGQTVASGIYLYRIETKQFKQTKKMMFIK